ncbi:PIG-L family deacetylase [Nonomuraea sp. NPDC003727]
MKRAVTALVCCGSLLAGPVAGPATATSGPVTSGPVTSGTVARGATACSRTTLVSVAHQDDDLLFVNPAIAGDHDAGACLRVVYLTAGDDGRVDDYVRSREDGVRAAYAVMAGAADAWRRSDLRVGGRSIRAFTLDRPPAGRGEIQLLFLGLPDGHPRGRGSASQGRQSLLKLFRGDIDRISTVDGTARYDAAALVATLRRLIERFRPDTIRTLDHHSTRLGFSLTEPVDHSDHAVTARYTLLAARQAMAATPGLRPAVVFYRAYGISALPPNLTPAEQARKSAVFAAYARHVYCRPGVCPAPPATLAAGDRDWVARQYRREAPVPAPGAIVSWMGTTSTPNDDTATARCLEVGPGRGAVRTHACAGSPAQGWYVLGASLRSALTGRCLSAGRVPVMDDCDGGRDQRWNLSPTGRIGTAAGCLHQDDLLARHARLRVVPCDGRRPEQRWSHGELEARRPAP